MVAGDAVDGACAEEAEMTTKTPIREAAEAVIAEIRPGNTVTVDSFEEIIKRALNERVPEKTFLYRHSEVCLCGDCGYNQCRKEIGL